MPIQSCIECGKPFESKYRGFCSDECRKAARRRQKKKSNQRRQANTAMKHAKANAKRDSYLPVRNVREMV